MPNTRTDYDRISFSRFRVLGDITVEEVRPLLSSTVKVMVAGIAFSGVAPAGT